MLATNYDDYIQKVGEETPHGLVLAEYRRLELSIREYLAARGLTYTNGRAAEKVIAADAKLGVLLATELRALREIRNKVAHDLHQLTSAEAEDFAKRAFALLGMIARQY